MVGVGFVLLGGFAAHSVDARLPARGEVAGGGGRRSSTPLKEREPYI